LHATARGVFTATINGVPVSDDVLSPGWSSYEWRLRYRSYDVTNLLRSAPETDIVLGIALGNGWFRGRRLDVGEPPHAATAGEQTASTGRASAEPVPTSRPGAVAVPRPPPVVN
jgi:hypothetical protein